MAQVGLFQLKSHVLWANYLVAYGKWLQDGSPEEMDLGGSLPSQGILEQFVEVIVNAAAEGKEEDVRALKKWEIVLMAGYEALKAYYTAEQGQ